VLETEATSGLALITTLVPATLTTYWPELIPDAVTDIPGSIPALDVTVSVELLVDHVAVLVTEGL
jgi:hypothetical protein